MSRMDRLSPYRTAWTTSAYGGSVTYAHTEIVRWEGSQVTLRSGGWETPTTKRKMNQAARQFGLRYSVYQHKGDWFVRIGRGRPAVPFVDGMTLDTDTGEVTLPAQTHRRY